MLFYQISVYHCISHYKKVANQDKFIIYRFYLCLPVNYDFSPLEIVNVKIYYREWRNSVICWYQKQS